MRKLLPILLLLLLLLPACDRQPPEHTAENLPAFEELPVNTYAPERFYEERGFVLYDDAFVGVDVSSHQEEIDWERVKNAGVDFAIIRAAYRGYTNGGLHADPFFLQNVQEAKAAGIRVGCYLFSQAISETEAREEAEFVLTYLDGIALDLPVYYDWEPIETEARTDNVSGAEVTAFAKIFCETVEAAGYRAGVYFNESMGYMFLRLPELKDYDFWLAQYKTAPDFYYNFSMWQYSADGEVDGIETLVDLNLRFAE